MIVCHYLESLFRGTIWYRQVWYRAVPPRNDIPLTLLQNNRRTCYSVRTGFIQSSRAYLSPSDGHWGQLSKSVSQLDCHIFVVLFWLLTKAKLMAVVLLNIVATKRQCTETRLFMKPHVAIVIRLGENLTINWSLWLLNRLVSEPTAARSCAKLKQSLWCGLAGLN